MATLVAENLGLDSCGKQVLREASAAFRPGEVHAIVGPNGAGKTSFLRLLGLLVRPTRGRVLIDGRDVTASWPDCLQVRRRIGLVQQQPVLFRASVLENAAAGLRFRGVKGAVLKERAREALRFVGLDGYEDRWPGSLSGGEAQKVALARAVAFVPEVLLLDEPTANLDPGSSTHIEERVAALSAGRGVTVIMVTHSLAQASRLAGRMHVICEGRLIESGPTSQVLASPKDPLTRQFIRSGTVALASSCAARRFNPEACLKFHKPTRPLFLAEPGLKREPRCQSRNRGGLLGCRGGFTL